MYPLLISLLMALLAGPAAAETPTELPAVAALADGRYAFHFATRDGVTGDCESFSVTHGPDRSVHWHRGHWPAREMAPGPAWITFQVRVREVVRLDLEVGECAGRPAAGTRDLGRIDGDAAAAWLLAVARRTRGDAGENAVMGAGLARDAEPADDLVDLVRDRRVDDDVRESGLHLLAVLAAEKVMGPAADIIADQDDEMDVRESAVFALSQLGDEAALDFLLEIGRDHPEPQLQRAAIFALSQYEDERVVAFYEEILRED